jgi:hypothetical protein
MWTTAANLHYNDIRQLNPRTGEPGGSDAAGTKEGKPVKVRRCPATVSRVAQANR